MMYQALYDFERFVIMDTGELDLPQTIEALKFWIEWAESRLEKIADTIGPDGAMVKTEGSKQ